MCFGEERQLSHSLFGVIAEQTRIHQVANFSCNDKIKFMKYIFIISCFLSGHNNHGRGNGMS